MGLEFHKKSAAERSRDIVPPATTSLSPRGGAKHRTMKKSILDLLKKAGEKGMTISEISNRLEVQKTRVQNWFSTTGKKTPGLSKVGVGQWKMKSEGDFDKGLARQH